METHDIDDPSILEHIEKRLGVLKWIAALGWGLLIGAFMLGIWTATLEIRQSTYGERLIDHEAGIKTLSGEAHKTAVNQAEFARDLAYIKASVERIENRIAK